MKKGAFFLLWSVVLMPFCFTTTGCNDRRPVADDSLSVEVDSDSIREAEEQSVMPKGADELFDDFFFNFAGNKRLQFQRIQFPLPVYEGDKQAKQLTKGQWQMDYFFMKDGYYTLIFDNAEQMEIVNDTSVMHVVVEKIFLNDKNVVQYVFDNVEGKWMLTAMRGKQMYQNTNASFLDFYHKFSTDSAFQAHSINEFVTFTAPDPDDDFSTITGTITPEQWPMFKPALIPEGVIYNIIYGQQYVSDSQKFFVVRGVANGLEIEMTFRRKGLNWKLVKFNS
jgi:hypothetical protein